VSEERLCPRRIDDFRPALPERYCGRIFVGLKRNYTVLFELNIEYERREVAVRRVEENENEQPDSNTMLEFALALAERYSGLKSSR
jgi:hypothetical protein